MFRGQKKAKWELVPQAWRSGKSDPFVEFRNQFRAIAELAYEESDHEYGGSVADDAQYYQRHENPLWIDIALQRAAELYAVREFTDLADKLGYPVPDADQVRLTENAPPNLVNPWVEPEEWIRDFFDNHRLRPIQNNSAFALAQHHGTPTSLLDWTEDGLMAAFFAARSVEPSDSYDIAVWCLHRSALENSTLRLVTPPRAAISYLQAQKGRFTFDQYGPHYFLKHGAWPSVREAQVWSEQLKPHIFNPGKSLKLTLPSTECGELLRLLWLESISQAHLMPTYDNITQALMSRAKWKYQA